MTDERGPARLDRIRIHQLALSCIVGIRQRERRVEQPVVIDLELGVDARLAAQSGRIAQTVDYVQVESSVSAMLRFRRYKLIESAAEELCAMLIGTHPQLQEVRIRIEKIRALEGKARAASVEIQRTREDFPPEPIRVAQSGGCLRGERLWRSKDAELSIVWLPPEALWEPAHVGRHRCINWVVSGQLSATGRTLEAGEVDVASCSLESPWSNRGAAEAVLFQCLAADGAS